MLLNVALVALVIELLLPAPLSAQELTSAWVPIPDSAVFATGDTWSVNGRRFRLYGVQACIRGSSYTGTDGAKRDCGDASLRMLTGLIRAWHPLCAPLATSGQAATAPTSTTYVICFADTTSAQGVRRIELGTALIASGFAFAAADQEGRPVSIEYWAAQRQAQDTKSGLWAFPGVPNPNDALINALKDAR